MMWDTKDPCIVYFICTLKVNVNQSRVVFVLLLRPKFFLCAVFCKKKLLELKKLLAQDFSFKLLAAKTHMYLLSTIAVLVFLSYDVLRLLRL